MATCATADHDINDIIIWPPSQSLSGASCQEAQLYLRFLIPLGLAVACWAQQAAPPPGRISLKVTAGQGAVNNIGMRVAAQPGVTVVDDSGAPVAGAEVIFQAPPEGPSGSFFGGMRTHTVRSDAAGKAQTSGFIPNDIEGKFKIQVRATLGAAVVDGVVDQMNGYGPGGGKGGKMTSGQKKMWTIIAVGAVAAIAGGVAASGGSDSTTAASAAKAPVSIGAGPITVGGPR